MNLAAVAAPAAPKIVFPVAEDFSSVAGVLGQNPFGGGLQITTPTENLVFGNPEELAGFQPGDVVQVTGRVSDSQVSFHMSGLNYDVAAAQAFTGVATLESGTGPRQLVYEAGRQVAAQG